MGEEEEMANFRFYWAGHYNPHTRWPIKNQNLLSCGEWDFCDSTIYFAIGWARGSHQRNRETTIPKGGKALNQVCLLVTLGLSIEFIAQPQCTFYFPALKK